MKNVGEERKEKKTCRKRNEKREYKKNMNYGSALEEKLGCKKNIKYGSAFEEKCGYKKNRN